MFFPNIITTYDNVHFYLLIVVINNTDVIISTVTNVN